MYVRSVKSSTAPGRTRAGPQWPGAGTRRRRPRHQHAQQAEAARRCSRNRPPPETPRTAGVYAKATAGTRLFFGTPQLRALLALNLAVAAASAMVTVNSVVYVRDRLGLDAADVSLAGTPICTTAILTSPVPYASRADGGTATTASPTACTPTDPRKLTNRTASASRRLAPRPPWRRPGPAEPHAGTATASGAEVRCPARCSCATSAAHTNPVAPSTAHGSQRTPVSNSAPTARLPGEIAMPEAVL